ncbi:MAG: DUF4383 domain-containing protein [Patescibacteria group bacterium UBA2163]
MIQKLAWVFGAVFLAVGVLGFVPGITTDGHLLGIFEVDAVHNIIHLLTGLIFVWGALASASTSQMVFKVVGVVYALVAIIGFVQGDTVLGLIATNMADHVLHVVLAVAILYIGFGMKSSGSAMPEMETPSEPMEADMGENTPGDQPPRV